MNKSLCPCGSRLKSTDCCQRFILGTAIPSTPEELMRSRYTAYTQANISYIAKTMKSPAADDFDPADVRAWARSIKWLRLEVLNSAIHGTDGEVEFRVYYSQKNQMQIMHEKSKFKLEDNQWYYIDGQS